MKKATVIFLILILAGTMGFAQGTKEDASTVTLEFMQWWEPEMKPGAMAKVISEFEAANPGIKVKLISKPYSEVQNQITIGSASGTLSDVMGIDPAWISNLVKQNAVTSFDSFIAADKYDLDQIAGVTALNGKNYMFAVATFVYPVFYNVDMFKAKGITKAPTTRSEFHNTARLLTEPAKNQFGWTLPLSLQNPNGIQNDVLSWVWASGGSSVPKVDNPETIEVLNFIASMYREGLISPGSMAKQEQDKVEEFVNGRVGMMISSLAHINMIRDRNPSLNFSITGFPVKDGYTGKSSLPYAAWGVGISKNTKHPEEAWKLVKHLLDAQVNSQIADSVNAFPGNVNANPQWVTGDDLYAKAFSIFQKSNIKNEFAGAPEAENLMRILNEQFQEMLNGKQTAAQAVQKAQVGWDKVYNK